MKWAVGLLVLLSGLAKAEDWPQFRGARRDGSFGESGLVERIGEKGLETRWRVEAGAGFASPVIVKGKVYLVDSELNRPTARERVRCFDEKSGAALWTYSYEVAYPDWAFDAANLSGPNATPVVSDGKIYAWGQVGNLVCLDAKSGEVLWKRRLDKEYDVKEFCGTPSPLIEGNLLIMFVGGRPGASVVAFEKDSGKEVWRALEEEPTYSSPMVLEWRGKSQLIVWTQASVSSLDPTSGKVYWREGMVTPKDHAIATPVFAEGWLLVGGLMMKMDPEKPGAKVVWPQSMGLNRRILSNTSTAMVRDGFVYAPKTSGELVCLEAATGKVMWEEGRVTDLKSGASIHLTPNGKRVFVYTDRGELICARLESEGYKEQGRAKLLEPTFPNGGRKVAWAVPAYADGCVFVRNQREMVCVSLIEKR